MLSHPMPRLFPLLRHTDRVDKSAAERRLETRFKINEPVKVTLLSDANESFWGETVDVSATGLSFHSPVRLQIGSLVKIEVDDSMVLGEVRHCSVRQDSADQCLVGMNVEHVLFGWRDLYERARELEIVAEESEALTPAVR